LPLPLFDVHVCVCHVAAVGVSCGEHHCAAHPEVA
jgi:hypothetical protein